MTTLELECERCGWSDFSKHRLDQCPECKAYGLIEHWDEQADCHDCDCHEAVPNETTDWEE